jgi:hypothetical protein
MRRSLSTQKEQKDMSSHIITVDRSTSFDPNKFLGTGEWAIVEENRASLARSEFDLTQVRFKSYAEKTRKRQTVPPDKIRRNARLRPDMSHSCIELDAAVLLTLWQRREEQDILPTTWQQVLKEGSTILFGGTLLFHPRNSLVEGMGYHLLGLRLNRNHQLAQEAVWVGLSPNWRTNNMNLLNGHLRRAVLRT